MAVQRRGCLGDTRWGMTPEQVQALNVDARMVRSGPRLSGMALRNKQRDRLAGETVDVGYYFDNAGLGMIRIDFPVSRCAALRDHLIASHGPPAKIEDQVLIQNSIWIDEPNQTHILLIQSQAGICDLRQRRLSDYSEPLSAFPAN